MAHLPGDFPADGHCDFCYHPELNKWHTLGDPNDHGSFSQTANRCIWNKHIEAYDAGLGYLFNYDLTLTIGSSWSTIGWGEDPCAVNKPYYILLELNKGIENTDVWGWPGLAPDGELDCGVSSFVWWRTCSATKFDCLNLNTVLPWLINSGGWWDGRIYQDDMGCDGSGATVIVES